MSDYLLMLHFDLLKLKNYFVEVRRTPKKLVSYVLFLGWILIIILPSLISRPSKSFNLTSGTLEIILGVYALIINVVIFGMTFSALKPFMLGRAAAPWSTAVLISLIVVSIYIAQGNMVALSYVLLPSSLDRKLFYPLLLFLQLLLVLIPTALAGGVIFLLSHNQAFAGLGIIAANIGVGALLLFLSEKIVYYIEMREFSND